MTAENLIEEAENALRQADPLCTSGDTYYEETKTLIEQTTVLWSRILFIHSAQQDQLQTLTNISSIAAKRTKEINDECKQKIKTLRSLRHDLRARIVSLKETRVDPAFKGYSCLFDYIHEESTIMLEKKIDELIEEANAKLNHLTAAPVEIQQHLSKLRAHIPLLPSTLNSTTLRKLNKSTIKCGSLVRGMAEILTSLTNNYDLCSQIPTLGVEDAAEATNVVNNDRQHVIEALSQLKTISGKLKTKYADSQRHQHSLAMSFEQFMTFDNTMSEFIAQELRPRLFNINDRRNSCVELFGRINEVTNETSGLSEYYRLFSKSYDALILEIERRHESHKQLGKLIENINNAIHGFTQREADSRAEFLNTYREYIPEELWPDVARVPHEYSIGIIDEDLPHISEETLNHAHRRK